MRIMKWKCDVSGYEYFFVTYRDKEILWFSASNIAYLSPADQPWQELECGCPSEIAAGTIAFAAIGQEDAKLLTVWRLAAMELQIPSYLQNTAEMALRKVIPRGNAFRLEVDDDKAMPVKKPKETKPITMEWLAERKKYFTLVDGCESEDGKSGWYKLKLAKNPSVRFFCSYDQERNSGEIHCEVKGPHGMAVECWRRLEMPTPQAMMALADKYESLVIS